MLKDLEKAILDRTVYIRKEPWIGGIRYEISFRNGYGASVVRNSMSYGVELAVLDNGSITYDTPITDDVIGYLKEEDLYSVLRQISNLKRKKVSVWTRLWNWVRGIGKRTTTGELTPYPLKAK